MRPALELSLELMAKGSYQVEMSGEGLMTDDLYMPWARFVVEEQQ